MRIAISPDEDPGRSGSVAADGTDERALNVRVASALQAALRRSGQDAWFDPAMTAVDRVAAANADGTALLVVCAHNSSTGGLSGTQFVFCPGGQTFGLQAAAASAVYEELAKIPDWPARLGDAVEDVYECCAFERDSVFTEYLFMSPEDQPLWSRPGYAIEAAEATARGLAAVYGFAYEPSPVAAWLPVPTDPDQHWWGRHVSGADQVVELPSLCHAAVWDPGNGHWYRNDTIIGVPQDGEYAEWTLANRVDGVWYVMDESGGPQGQGPMGKLPPALSYWIEDSVTDSAGCGGSSPPRVARSCGGSWWSI